MITVIIVDYFAHDYDYHHDCNGFDDQSLRLEVHICYGCWDLVP